VLSRYIGSSSFDRLGTPFELARSLEMLADLVEEPERSDLLTAALASYDALGARPFADRVRAALGGKVTSPF